MHRRDLIKAGVAGYAASRIVKPGASRVARRGGPVPSPQHLAWHDSAMGMFTHFGINTFTDREWGLGNEDPKLFNPTNLDARQWVRTAVATGCRYIILTAKHHDGFCLWPTSTTTHSVKSSPWRGGNGDVVREVADAAREGGIGFGVYLSPWDRNAKSYGTGQEYNEFYAVQLAELLMNYGPLTEVWFDGANGEGPNGKKQKYDWPRIHGMVRRLQPRALIFSDSGPDIRWIGNERGSAGDPNWCTVDPSIVTEPGMDGPNIISSLQHGNPPPQGTVWRPGEADVSIRPGWFHHPAEDTKLKTSADLMTIWMNSVGRGANLLLNVPPTRDGIIADADVQRLNAFTVIRAARGARNVLRPFTQLPSPLDGALFEQDLGGPLEVSGAWLQEDLSKGQMVAKYHIDVLTDGAWKTVASGTTIGNLKIDQFPPVVATKGRLLIESAIDKPTIRTFVMRQ